MICVHIKDFDAKNLCKNKFPSILRFISIKIYSLSHNKAEVPNNKFCFVSIDTYLWIFAKYNQFLMPDFSHFLKQSSYSGFTTNFYKWNKFSLSSEKLFWGICRIALYKLPINLWCMKSFSFWKVLFFC